MRIAFSKKIESQGQIIYSTNSYFSDNNVSIQNSAFFSKPWEKHMKISTNDVGLYFQPTLSINRHNKKRIS